MIIFWQAGFEYCLTVHFTMKVLQGDLSEKQFSEKRDRNIYQL